MKTKQSAFRYYEKRKSINVLKVWVNWSTVYKKGVLCDNHFREQGKIEITRKKYKMLHYIKISTSAPQK